MLNIANRFRAILPIAFMAALACLMISGRCQSSVQDSQKETVPVSSESSTENAAVPEISKDVYVAGNETLGGKRVATLWKNGSVLHRLTNGNNHAEAYSVYVSGSDAYVAGYEQLGGNNVATLWKNGSVMHRLSNGDNHAEALSVYVSGSDAYVAGHDGTSAMLWKNGNALHRLNSGNNNAGAWSVFVK
jgi:hypothetical protein